MKYLPSNIQKIYAFNFFWLFSVLLPVLYPYYSTLGVNMEQFLQLQAVFGLTVATLDIPTGYFCDRYGRKISILMAGLLTGVAYIVLWHSKSFSLLVVHEIILGAALSFLSGADIAMLYDSLPAQSSRKEFRQILGRGQLAFAFGESAGALICGWLVAQSYHAVLLSQLMISWFPFLVALTLTEPKKMRAPIYNKKTIQKMWNHLLHETQLTRLLTWHFVQWLVATYVIIWIVQKFWKDENVPVTYFGVLWALYNLSMGLSAFASHHLEKRFSPRQLLEGTALLCVMGYFLMSWLEGWMGIAAAILLYCGRGINNVVSRDLLNIHIPSELRATANSILNFLFRIIFAVLGPGVGYAIDHLGMRWSLFGLSVLFFAGYLLITRPLSKMIKDI